MRHTISLGLFLTALWLVLSGYFDNVLLLSFGAASVIFVLYIAHRMDVVDHEGAPVHLTVRIFAYWPWLFWEIVKANWDVTKRVLSPSLDISPTLFVVKTSQETEIGQVLYANSITLTPGTVSIDLADDEILVHALSLPAAKDLEAGGMDAKVSQTEVHP